MITARELSDALLDVGREVTDEDAAAFAAIDPTAPGAGLSIALLIGSRFSKPGPPPQVHRVTQALLIARRNALRSE